MNNEPVSRPAATGAPWRGAIAAKAGDLIPPCDFAGLLLAGHLSLLAYAAIAPSTTLAQSMGSLSRLVWVAASIAPFVLYERRFAAAAGQVGPLLSGVVRRFILFVGLVCAIAFAGRWLEDAPGGWLALWFGSAIVVTISSRVLLARWLRRFTPDGGLAMRPGAGTPIPDSHVGEVGGGLQVILLADRPIKRWNAALKTAEDFVLGSFAMVLLLPLLGCIAVAIKLDSPGPVVFKQRRDGFNNGGFDIYKFRTMRSDPQAPGQALQQTVRGDRRITRVGRFLRKFSLDELPQVFNVIEGTMSLVGPRPHAVNMRTEERLGHEIIDLYPHRHRVKPGITGWSQINGCRGATATAEELRRRVELDLHYVEHWSLLLDLKILSLTFKEVLRTTNAF